MLIPLGISTTKKIIDKMVWVEKKKRIGIPPTAPGVPRWSPTPVLSWRSEA